MQHSDEGLESVCRHLHRTGEVDIVPDVHIRDSHKDVYLTGREASTPRLPYTVAAAEIACATAAVLKNGGYMAACLS